VGGERDLAVDVRIVAATNRHLAGEVRAGRFRSDLYHRLNVFQIRLPTLAERPEDIEELVWAIIGELNLRAHRRIARVPDTMWTALKSRPWSGNVRELRNVIERCVLLSEDDTLDSHWLQLGPASVQRKPDPASPEALCFELDGLTTMLHIERQILEEALRRRGGNVTQAARLLGMSRQSMRYRVEKHRLGTHVVERDAKD
jgi:two-component system response regulator AtoC